MTGRHKTERAFDWVDASRPNPKRKIFPRPLPRHRAIEPRKLDHAPGMGRPINPRSEYAAEVKVSLDAIAEAARGVERRLDLERKGPDE